MSILNLSKINSLLIDFILRSIPFGITSISISKYLLTLNNFTALSKLGLTKTNLSIKIKIMLNKILFSVDAFDIEPCNVKIVFFLKIFEKRVNIKPDFIWCVCIKSERKIDTKALIPKPYIKYEFPSFLAQNSKFH